jgi:hypothetical protein
MIPYGMVRYVLGWSANAADNTRLLQDTVVVPIKS